MTTRPLTAPAGGVSWLETPPASASTAAAAASRYRMLFPGFGDALLHGDQDLVLLGEAPDLVLREDRLSVEDHVEDPVLALRELGIDPEIALDGGRQTGGLGQVVSDRAVNDLDAVRLLRLRF